MTQEEKSLLLQDLCARLPYGVIVKYMSRESKGNVKLGCGNIGYVLQLGNGWWKECKPYLRPMSSMTEEEAKEYFSIQTGSIRGDMIAKIDFYIKHHFDFRLTSEGLSMIETGLALEAPEEMYK